MGFRREPTHYKLKFEDEQFNGLEVVAKALPLKDFLEINRLAAESSDDPGKQAEQAGVIFSKFAGALVSWNLEDEHGKPVPATYKGVESQELGFVNEVVRAWMEAISGVPKASKNGSHSGETFQELSLPMEV